MPFALVLGWSPLMLVAFVAMEVALLGVLPQTSAFREAVMRKEAADEAIAASRTRERLLLRMTAGHREELQRLEVLADSLSVRLSPVADDPGTADYLGVSRLLATYVGGAVAYASAVACLAGMDRGALELEMCSLAEGSATRSSEAARALAARRLEVLRLRAARWDRSHDELAVMRDQLALVADVVRLLYEHAVAPVRSPVVDEQAERALANAADGQHLIRQLTELLAAGDTPSPEVLQLGRHALAAMARAQAPAGRPAASQVRVTADAAMTPDVEEAEETRGEWSDFTRPLAWRALGR